jgi:hypothetical protein
VVICPFHLKPVKEFGGPVKRIHVTAAAFYKYADFATRSFFCKPNSFYNPFSLLGCKKFFWLLPGK